MFEDALNEGSRIRTGVHPDTGDIDRILYDNIALAQHRATMTSIGKWMGEVCDNPKHTFRGYWRRHCPLCMAELYEELCKGRECDTLKEKGMMARCAYCHQPPDGPMLRMGDSMAHVDCLIRQLNILLDDGIGEPKETVGFLSRFEPVQRKSKERRDVR